MDDNSHWLKHSIRVIDFGISFFLDEPPAFLGTPPSFVAPEKLFEDTAGISTDPWALGCTIYTLRSLMTLVRFTWGGSPFEVIGETSSFLEAPPERWNRLWIDDEGIARPREELEDCDELPAWTSEEF